MAVDYRTLVFQIIKSSCTENGFPEYIDDVIYALGRYDGIPSPKHGPDNALNWMNQNGFGVVDGDVPLTPDPRESDLFVQELQDKYRQYIDAIQKSPTQAGSLKAGLAEFVIDYFSGIP